MFHRAGLALSLPARELGRAVLPRAVFEPEALAQAPLSEALRGALALVLEAAASRDTPVRIVARPEIFTHGDSLAWLREQLGAGNDHLCLSDGACIQSIPTLRNHVFFYDLATRANAEALRRLFARAPEILSSVETQVSSAFRTRVEADHWTRPSTLVLQASAAPAAAAPTLLPFVFDRRSIALSAQRSLAGAGAPMPDRRRTRQIGYLPLTETALADAGFMRGVGALVARAFFDRAAWLILGLPRLPGARDDLVARLCVALEGFAAAGAQGLPRARAQTVFFLDGAFPAESLKGVDLELMLHESQPIWRETRAWYKAFDRIRVFAPRAAETDAGLLDVVAGIARKTPLLALYGPEG